MASTDLELQALEGLSAAILAGRLPSSVLPRAEELRDQLRAPLRIALFGVPGIGKTGVLNLLAGGTVVPPHLNLGTVRVTYGLNKRTEYTFADGETIQADDLPHPSHVSDVPPLLTHVQAPMAALAKISLLEVAPSSDMPTQIKAITWAAKQTDIALWCTAQFSQDEADLWSNVPDRLRDHSVLLQTQADRFGDQRDAAIQKLNTQAGEQFAYVLNVSVQQANQATAGGTVNKAAMRASGATKLISTILGEIEDGRQSLVDQADVLLRLYPEIDVARVAQETPEPVVEDVQSATLPDVAAPPEDTQTQATNILAFQDAVERLSKTGQVLMANDEADAESVLAASADTLEWLSEHLEETDLPETKEFVRLRAMTQDAEDLVQLLRIEGSSDGTTDAILALLQLKRGFQAALAA